MSQLVPEETKLPVQRTDYGPRNLRDRPSWWRRFCDGVRQTIGLKPLYLAEEFARAKIDRERAAAEQERASGRAREMEAAAKLVEAGAQYQLARAKADAIGRGEAELKPGSRDDGVDDLVRTLLAGRRMSPGDAQQQVLDAIKRIELQGGSVEIDVSDTVEETGPEHSGE